MKIIKPHANGNQIFIENINLGNIENKTEAIEVLSKLATSVQKMAQSSEVDKKVADKVTEAAKESQKGGNSQIIVQRLSEAQALLGGVGTATKLIGEFIAAAELVRKFF